MAPVHKSAHETFMRRCLLLAEKGLGHVAPNPMVGSLLVHEGQVIGEGFHEFYGGPHAEVNAVAAAGSHVPLSKCSLYVSLEPCVHFGKTPPCADFLIEKKIPRVIVATVDPFPQVSGKGIEKLRHAGIDVTVGVLEAEARFLNRRFLSFHRQKRPFIILATDAEELRAADRASWRNLMHNWEHEESAFFPGSFLTVRRPEPETRAIEGKDLPTLLRDLYHKQVQSLLLTPASPLFEEIISQNLWDEIRLPRDVQWKWFPREAEGIRAQETSHLRIFTRESSYIY